MEGCCCTCSCCCWLAYAGARRLQSSPSNTCGPAPPPPPPVLRRGAELQSPPSSGLWLLLGALCVGARRLQYETTNRAKLERQGDTATERGRKPEETHSLPQEGGEQRARATHLKRLRWPGAIRDVCWRPAPKRTIGQPIGRLWRRWLCARAKDAKFGAVPHKPLWFLYGKILQEPSRLALRHKISYFSAI